MTERSEAAYQVLKALEQIRDTLTRYERGRKIRPDKRDYRQVWSMVQEHQLEGLLECPESIYIMANSMATYSVVEHAFRFQTTRSRHLQTHQELMRVSLPDRPDLINLLNAMADKPSLPSEERQIATIWQSDPQWSKVQCQSSKLLVLPHDAIGKQYYENRRYRLWALDLMLLGKEREEIYQDIWESYPGFKQRYPKSNLSEKNKRLGQILEVEKALQEDGAHWLLKDKKQQLALAQLYDVATLPTYDYDHVHSLAFAASFPGIAEHQPLFLWVALLRLAALGTTIFVRAYPDWLYTCIMKSKKVEPDVDWDAAVVTWGAVLRKPIGYQDDDDEEDDDEDNDDEDDGDENDDPYENDDNLAEELEG